ncbi:hypothetical protein Bca4012_057177 [Brassica carinata]
MVLLWCGKLKLSKPYLALATQTGSHWFSSRGSLSHHHHNHHSLISNGIRKIFTRLEHHVTWHTWTQNPVVGGPHRTVSSITGQDVTIETFDGFCNNGNLREAIEVLDHLQNHGHAIDLIRLLRLAKLCDRPEVLEEAKFVHERIVSLASDPSDVSSRNAIIEMYSRCGSVVYAVKLFHEMSVKNTETWCVMMRCFVSNGYGEQAIGFFTRFKQQGNKPDGEIFKEGSLQFEAMQKDYGIKPSMEHYNSVTKMLAISGHLDEALSFIEKMPVEPSVDVWETLMNLSRVHGAVELGDRCAELVEKLDATRLDKASSAGLVANVNYKYNRTKHTSDPEMDMIYEMLKSLQLQMLEMGYVPSTREWRNERVVKENREEWTFGYKEEVAVVKKLLDSRPRSPVTVISNFRICQDCHDALKFMSVITGRQLTKRDSKRFHHISKGICSCKDRCIECSIYLVRDIIGCSITHESLSGLLKTFCYFIQSPRNFIECGEITAGFPFWGGNRLEHCGLPLLELHCRNKSSTYLIISDQEFSVLKVGQSSYTVTLARSDLLGPLCSAKFKTTVLPSDIFEILPNYKDLTVYYLCDPIRFSKRGHTCPPDKGLVLLPEGIEYGEIYCNNSFTVNVPTSFVPGEFENVHLLVEYAASVEPLKFAARQTHHPQESAANQSVNLYFSY